MINYCGIAVLFVDSELLSVCSFIMENDYFVVYRVTLNGFVLIMI